MRTSIIAGNWKMNTTLVEAQSLAEGIRQQVSGIGETEIVLIPPFPWLLAVGEIVSGSNITVGAQNCYTEASGAFTGEVAAEMLADHCSHVIVGHSERRHVLGETDELVAQKVRAVLRAGLNVILCVGETLDEREAGAAQETVQRQLNSALADLSDAKIDHVVIAYEPVWAIGTGVAASVSDAQEMAAFVRKRVGEQFSSNVASQIRIQYGGSVNASNASELLGSPDIDGALVGGASLKADEFAAIIRAASRSRD